ncbi:MAG: molybdenum cofactor guanylyltransferase [Clostridiaceae bacterium]|nr:molybdenum cofactor guanylyltransferase [Clostridiaceae bacterium]
MLYDATGLVLAGGKSSRIGTDKALLKLNNMTLLEYSLGKLKGLFKEVMVSVDIKGKYNIDNSREVIDVYPDCGPLGGIHAGIKNAQYEWVFVTACDMPLWEDSLVVELMKRRNGYDAVVPVINNKTEPLFALYNKTCLPLVENNLNKRKYKVSDLYTELNVNYINAGELPDNGLISPSAFININTSTDYNIVLKGFLEEDKI